MSWVKKLRTILFENQSVRQTVFKNTFWLSVGELVGRLLRVWIVIYAARILGAEQWGVFSYAVSLSALFAVFSDTGISAVLTRESAKGSETRATYFATTFVLKLLLVVISALIMFLGIPRVAPFELSSVLLGAIILLFVFDAFRGFLTSFFRSLEKMEWEALVNIVTQFIILVFGFMIFRKVFTPESLALAYAAGALGGLLLALIMVRSYFRGIFSHVDRGIFKEIIKTAWPFSIAGILSIVMLNTDTVMLGWFTSIEGVGYYAAAQKPILFLYVVPSLLAGGFFPVLARYAYGDPQKFRQVLERGLSAILLLAFPLAAGTVLIAPDVVHLLFGIGYLPAVSALRILALTIITTFPMHLLYYGLFAYNKQRDLTLLGFGGVVANVILNTLLIPILGIEGAAWATFATQIVNTGLLWMRMNQTNPFGVIRGLGNGILGTIIMASVVMLLVRFGVPVLVTVFGGVVVYGAVLLLRKEPLLFEIKRILG